MSTGIVSESDQKLEEDFLFYIEHFKSAFDGLKSDCEKEICEVAIIRLIYSLFPRNIHCCAVCTYYLEMARQIGN